jgi:hypothetical protein
VSSKNIAFVLPWPKELYAVIFVIWNRYYSVSPLLYLPNQIIWCFIIAVVIYQMSHFRALIAS